MKSILILDLQIDRNHVVLEHRTGTSPSTARLIRGDATRCRSVFHPHFTAEAHLYVFHQLPRSIHHLHNTTLETSNLPLISHSHTHDRVYLV